jgi:hypothetical protein
VKLGVDDDEHTTRALKDTIGKRLTGCLTTEWSHAKSRHKANKAAEAD